MNICVECKHVVHSSEAGSSNVGCGKAIVKPTCDPVTGDIVASGPALRIERDFDRKTASVTYYAHCHNVNKGDCDMYEPAV